MIYTTLNKIRERSPCRAGWEKLLKHLGKTKSDDEQLSLEAILDSNGLDDALWCIRAIPEHDSLWRLYAVWCARQVQHLMKDERSIKALDVAEAYARRESTDNDLEAARVAAHAAWYATDAARDSARVAWVAWAATDAVWVATDGARVAHDVARVAHDAKRASQEAKFREIIKTGEV